MQGEITCTEDGVSALDAEECANYRGYALDDGSNGPVARVFIEDQGWRDVPIGKPDLTRDEVYGDMPYDRCEQVRIGPNFGRLGIPVPPHYQWRQDRYKTRCELKKRECSSFHRATRIGCSGNNQHYLALVIDYYIDCADDFRGDDPSTRVPCRSTEDYIWGEKRNGDPTFCNRGAENPFDPALGYRWDVPLCLTTPECIRMGESVRRRPPTRARGRPLLIRARTGAAADRDGGRRQGLPARVLHDHESVRGDGKHMRSAPQPHPAAADSARNSCSRQMARATLWTCAPWAPSPARPVQVRPPATAPSPATRLA